MLRRMFLMVAVLIPLLVGASGVLLLVRQTNDNRLIARERRTIATHEELYTASLLLAQQRTQLAHAHVVPLRHEDFAELTADFREALQETDLPSPSDRALLSRIRARQQEFSRAVLALPPAPSTAQILSVDAKGEAVTDLLADLRTRHGVDLSALADTERQQRELSLIVLATTMGGTLILVVAGFALLGRLGEQQAEASSLRATNQLRKDFVAFAAHELRNPASAILTGASLLREPDLDPQLREQVVDSINRSANGLTRLVMNLLAMGRTEEGRIQLRRVAMPLPRLVGDLISEMEVYHPGIERRINCRLPGAAVYVDPDYIKLVLSNLLDNAIKYSPPRSTLRVVGEVAGGMASIHVQDEGVGIPPEELPRIFAKYETRETAPGMKHRGFGLGLYMARMLVEAHGGTICASSQPGSGTTICFDLPLAGGPDRASERPETAPAGAVSGASDISAVPLAPPRKYQV